MYVCMYIYIYMKMFQNGMPGMQCEVHAIPGRLDRLHERFGAHKKSSSVSSVSLSFIIFSMKKLQFRGITVSSISGQRSHTFWCSPHGLGKFRPGGSANGSIYARGVRQPME